MLSMNPPHRDYPDSLHPPRPKSTQLSWDPHFSTSTQNAGVDSSPFLSTQEPDYSALSAYITTSSDVSIYDQDINSTYFSPFDVMSILSREYSSDGSSGEGTSYSHFEQFLEYPLEETLEVSGLISSSPFLSAMPIPDVPVRSNSPFVSSSVHHDHSVSPPVYDHASFSNEPSPNEDQKCVQMSDLMNDIPPLRLPTPQMLSVPSPSAGKSSPPTSNKKRRRPKRVSPSSNLAPDLPSADDAFIAKQDDSDPDPSEYEPDDYEYELTSDAYDPSDDDTKPKKKRVRKSNTSDMSSAATLLRQLEAKMKTSLSDPEPNFDVSSSSWSGSISPPSGEFSAKFPPYERRPGPGRKPTLPHPVAVPSLFKPSRGRKVPISVTSNIAADSATSVSGGIKKNSGSRRYVCIAEGCGKSFMRGEHLKRHVRSLHTYDKPHPCPYEDCDKSFSRRDNLAQHVKVHIHT